MLVFAGLCIGWSPASVITLRFSQAWEVVSALAVVAVPRSYQGFFKQLRVRGPWLFGEVLVAMRPQIVGRAKQLWKGYGWVPMAADGSRLDLPRTVAHEEAFGCAGRKGTGPQLWLTTLTHLPTGQIWSWRQGAGTASERRHLEAMLDDLPPESLLITDAGFISYGFAKELLRRGQDFLLRCGNNVTLRLAGEPVRSRIEKRGGIARVILWPQAAQAKRQEPVVLRLIVLKHKKQKVYLLTNVMSSQRMPRRVASEFYRMRWGIEVTYRHLKQTLERRCLRCGSPANALAELAMNVLALAVLVLQGLCILGAQADRLSIAAVRNAIRKAMEGQRWGVTWRDFARVLTGALQDSYPRHGPKAPRPRPRKKKDKPPRPPVLQTLSPQERSLMKQLGRRIPKTG